MTTEIEAYLLQALKKLEKASEEIRRTKGYTAEAEELQILIELAKEQVPHEKPCHSTRETR